jgi:hypothetical protein
MEGDVHSKTPTPTRKTMSLSRVLQKILLNEEKQGGVT